MATDKTLNFLAKFEKYSPIISGVLFAISIWFIPEPLIKKLIAEPFVTAVLNLSGVNFGFLLAILAILLSIGSSNTRMAFIIESGQFGRLIAYNKIPVFISGAVCISSMVLLLHGGCSEGSPCLISCWGKFLISVWTFLSIYTISATVRFTIVFYSILPDKPA